MPITLAVEGIHDEAVVRRVCAEADVEIGPVYVRGGKSALDRSIRAYNAAARFAPWIIVRDLDSDADCAPELVNELLPGPERNAKLRIAVHSIEAWLLADHERLAPFLGISPSLIPHEPERELRPKRTLVDLARRSRRTAIRRGMVPLDGTRNEVGIEYTAYVTEFALEHWDPSAAAARAPSLAKCLRVLSEFSHRP